jgi:transposase
VSARREGNPEREVEVWAFDEHRVGLKPVLRRQWAPKGRRPVAEGQHRYEWLYLYAFVHPSTGEVVWFVCTTVDTDLFSAVLAAFARAVGAGEDKLIVLVLDNAGWHVSDGLAVPDGVVLEFLPPYTPELQPAERLWPLTNEAVANKSFATLEDLDAALGERCRTLAAMPEIIKARTSYEWWPTADPVASPTN